MQFMGHSYGRGGEFIAYLKFKLNWVSCNSSDNLIPEALVSLGF